MVPSNLIAATFQKYKTVTQPYTYNVTLPNDTIVVETGERVEIGMTAVGQIYTIVCHV